MNDDDLLARINVLEADLAEANDRVAELEIMLVEVRDWGWRARSRFVKVAGIARNALTECDRLRRQIEGHCRRIADQSELLTRKAAKDAAPDLISLVVDMRRYVIHHDILLSECVAWKKLKEITGVGQNHDCPSEDK